MYHIAQNGRNRLSCCSEVHPCCDCPLGEGHHCHVERQKVENEDDDSETEIAKLPLWCRGTYLPDICTETDVTKEIIIRMVSSCTIQMN